MIKRPKMKFMLLPIIGILLITVILANITITLNSPSSVNTTNSTQIFNSSINVSENLDVYLLNATTYIWYTNGSLFHTNTSLPAESPSSSNLFAHYKFNTNSSVKADYTGNGNDGVINGSSPIFSNTGKINSSYYSVNGSGTIALPSSMNIANASFSIAFWVNISSCADTGLIVPTVSFRNASLRGMGFQYSDDCTFSFRMRNDTDSLGFNVGMLPLNTWVHIVGTFDNTTKNMTAYRDGVMNNTGLGTVLNITGSNSVFGSNVISGTGANGFVAIDDLRVYTNKVLNSTEVSTIYNSGSGTEKIGQTSLNVVSPLTMPDGSYVWNTLACSNNITLLNCSIHQSNRSLTIDTIIPVIALVSPTPENDDKSYGSIYVNTTSTEENLKNITFTLYNEREEVVNATTFTTRINATNFSGLSEGVYYVDVIIRDVVGYESSTQRIRVFIQDISGTPYISPFDFFTIFISYFLGNQEYFAIAFFLIVSALCGYLQIPDKIFLPILIVGGVMFGAYMGQAWYTLIVVIVGFILYKAFSRTWE